MSIATALAGVNMRLEAGAIREMHWHNDGEVYSFLTYLK
jgi:oxalate decarboxylase/phosphoglucose isomerase-like protein (cupin superfamily)